MLSALKRLTGNKENNGSGTPPGHQAMSYNLQKKFSKGVQYNMKIIIKGDRNTGKTCLFHRLQGKKFIQEYIPTEEIQVASIQWSYKTTDDIVKVEVWDVVDKGRKRIPLEGLKLGDAETNLTPALDAEFLDVYKGTHGVILVMDITKNWTFEYIQKEILKVPEHIPILVLGNHCDMSHHRTVTRDLVTYFIESIQRPPGMGQIRYTEASMSNGFGLIYLHKYLCIPFLQLQREALMGQIERNSHETSVTLQELDLYQQDSDYDTFLAGLSRKRREAAENASSAQSSVGPLPVGQGVSLASGPNINGAPAVPPVKPVQPPTSVSLASNILLDNKTNSGLVGALDSSVTNVDEFVPDGGVLDKSFLEESPPGRGNSVSKTPQPSHDSDSEASEGGNPLVSGYQDDLDPDDSLTSAPPLPTFEAPPVLQTETQKEEMANWLGRLEDRGSPEGGEDNQDNLDNASSNLTGNNNSCTVIKNNNIAPVKNKEGKTAKHKQKHKKKPKEKEDIENKEEKRKRKKSIGKNSSEQNELEDFLNSHDPTYEAL